ncbi:hypothetical protein ABPG75_011259 [Micractinium tetrahymenae]
MDAYVSPGLCRLNLLPAFSQLSGLTSLDLSGNAFTALPPALALATSLVRLDLSDNTSMPLTTGDLDALLALSPRLSSLLLLDTRAEWTYANEQSGPVWAPAAHALHLTYITDHLL